MPSSPTRIIPSGISPAINYDAAIFAKVRELCDLYIDKTEAFLSQINQAQHDCLERLTDWTPTERLMTVPEAAAYLGFSPRTIYAWVSQDPPVLKFSRLGGELRFKKQWLDDALERGAIKPRGIVKL